MKEADKVGLELKWLKGESKAVDDEVWTEVVLIRHG
jgi:hypothetical protein